ncbi:hypothetical protein ACOMHN_060655 [Nucella lapillus]
MTVYSFVFPSKCPRSLHFLRPFVYPSKCPFTSCGPVSPPNVQVPSLSAALCLPSKCPGPFPFCGPLSPLQMSLHFLRPSVSPPNVPSLPAAL